MLRTMLKHGLAEQDEISRGDSMKRVIAFLLINIFILSSVAAAMDIQLDACYDFTGDIYGISNIDTNGEIFVGVCGNKLAISSDFDEWQVRYDLDNVVAVVHTDGKFRAFAAGYTLTSVDGDIWERVENNLPVTPIEYNVYVKNDDVVVFGNNREENFAGTYHTNDAITWTRVENIPDGSPIRVVNDKFIFESAYYMSGVYYSDDGKSFTRCDIPGYNEQRCGVFYDGEKYYIEDFTTIPEDNKGILRTSYDLINWTEQPIDMFQQIVFSGGTVMVNGKLHRLSINGDDYVLKDDEWVRGDYNMNITWQMEISNPPFVYYYFTEHGILAWGTDARSWFIKNDGTFMKYDDWRRQTTTGFHSDGEKIYLGSETENKVVETIDFVNWQDSTKTIEELRKLYNSVYPVSNGAVTLTPEFIERGSYSYLDTNPVITAELKDTDGNLYKVAYEYATGDTVNVHGGNGFFLMGDFAHSNRMWYSKDGINRYEIINLPDKRGKLLSNKEYFGFTDADDVLRFGRMSQFENIELPESIRVKLNDEFLSFATAPVVESGRTLVPIRFLFERMGSTVEWNDAERSATVSMNGQTLKVTIDDTTAIVNGNKEQLDVPARLINNKTMIPLRFISERLGADVTYDEENHIAIVKN